MYSNTFTLFGLLFLSSLLLGNGLGLYSNPVAAQKTNEAEVNADIEQENKCKKDTECENENEINNQLSITTITQTQHQEQQETPTCETCFTDNLSENAKKYIEDNYFPEPLHSLQEICNDIDSRIQIEQYRQGFVNWLFTDVLIYSDATEQDLDNLLNCLEEVFGVTFPETNIAR